MNKIVKGGVYQHYKGKNYRLIDVVLHSETLEEFILYEALYENEHGKLWVRPKKMFLENVHKDVPRFKYIENN